METSTLDNGDVTQVFIGSHAEVICRGVALTEMLPLAAIDDSCGCDFCFWLPKRK